MAKSTINTTVEEKLKFLYELQLINTQLDELKKLQGELPLEVAALEDNLTKLDESIASIEEEQKDLELQIVKYQNEIKDSEALIEKYNRRQDDVKNNREFEALTREVELQKLDIQLAKKRIQETQGKLERKGETLEASKLKKENKLEDLRLKNEELEKITTKTEKKEKTLGNKEKRARKKIEPELLVSYDKIRNNYKNGLAVVTVERNSCGGCFAEIPPQLQLDMMQRKRIISCEHCGRILVERNIL